MLAAICSDVILSNRAGAFTFACFADLTRGKVHEINIAWINKPFETLPFVPDAKQLSLRGI